MSLLHHVWLQWTRLYISFLPISSAIVSLSLPHMQDTNMNSIFPVLYFLSFLLFFSSFSSSFWSFRWPNCPAGKALATSLTISLSFIFLPLFYSCPFSVPCLSLSFFIFPFSSSLPPQNTLSLSLFSSSFHL